MARLVSCVQKKINYTRYSRNLKRSLYRLEDNIKMDIIRRIWWLMDLLKKAMNICVPRTTGNFFISWDTASFLIRHTVKLCFFKFKLYFFDDDLPDVFAKDNNFVTSQCNRFSQCSIYVARGDEEPWRIEKMSQTGNRKRGFDWRRCVV
jgi:hypothetical protein